MMRSSQICWTAAAALWAAGVQAQTSAGAPQISGPALQGAPGPATSPGKAKVEDIIVTAQKRRENLQNVPISVTALTSRSLKLANLGNTISLSEVTPGLTNTKTGDAPIIFLRGVGTALGGIPGDEGGVNILVDGVVYTSLPGSLFSLADISNIEVLRGPQGTLFGRNAAGGVINITTRDPSQKPSADIAVSYGNYNTVGASAYVSGGLTPTLAGNLAVQYDKQNDGYGRNLYNGQYVNLGDDFAARTKLLWTPTPDTKVTVVGDYEFGTTSAGLADRVLPGALSVIGTRGTANFYDVDENIQPLSTLHSGGASVRIDQTLDFATVSSISAYRASTAGFDFDQDGTQVPIIDALFHDQENQFTEELQIASLASSRIKWIAGLFYLTSDAKERPLNIGGLPFGPVLYDKRFGSVGTDSYAGFVQTTVPIGWNTNITGGLRYTDDNRSFVFHDISGIGIPLLPAANTSKTFDRLTFRAEIDHRFAEQILAYVSVSSGFKAGTFNVINPLNPPIQPEKLTAYEAGVKTQLFDDRLRFNASGFYYDYANIQVSEIIQGTAFYLNAPGTVYGGDIDFEATPLPNLTISGGLEALHSEYGDFPNAPGSLPLPAVCGPSGPIALAGPPAGGNITCPTNARGNQLIRAPSFTSTVTATYIIPTELGDFGASTTYAHSARFPWEVDNRLQQRTTDLVNGQIYWESPGNRYALRLWAKNLTDDHYLTLASSSLGDTGAAAAPRTYGFTLEAHFR